MNKNQIEWQYLDIMRNILEDGSDNMDRTGIGTKSLFGDMFEHDMRKGFPLLTTKKMAFSSVVAELLWFLKGSTNVNELRVLTHGEENRFNESKKTIWDANYNKQAKDLGYSNGNLGPIYGYQWRNFNGSGIDQVKNLIEEAKKNPSSRRLIVSAWNPEQIDQMALPPCHYLWQINIDGDFIDLLWSQRSCDWLLGIPFNLASYSILLLILGRILNKTPRQLVGQFANIHIYNNHIEQAKEQIGRIPNPMLPEVLINPKLKTLEDFENATVNDFTLINYKPQSTIKAPMAV